MVADCPVCGEELDLEDELGAASEVVQDAELECPVCGEPLHVDVDVDLLDRPQYKLLSDTDSDDVEEDL